MPSKLYLNGRVYSSGYQHPYAGPVWKTPEMPGAEEMEINHPPPPRKPDTYVDGPHNIRYRVIDTQSDVWIALPDLLKISGRDVEWVVDMVYTGKLDAAMYRGSTVPRFRIREPAILVTQAAPVEAKKPKRNNSKNGWHKQ